MLSKSDLIALFIYVVHNGSFLIIPSPSIIYVVVCFIFDLHAIIYLCYLDLCNNNHNDMHKQKPLFTPLFFFEHALRILVVLVEG